MKAYKLFRIKNGLLYPLYVYANQPVPIGCFVDAIEGERKPNGRVKSIRYELAFRPGWHVTEYPLANHIGKKQNGILVQRKDTVWCEVEISDSINYTEIAKKKNPRDSYLKYIPVNGYYYYQTNPNAKVRWMIAGSLKVIRILEQEEIIKILKEVGLEAQPLEA